ncbi:MAG: NfeD family protein [Candidatus Thorarchaeota archaeon]
MVSPKVKFIAITVDELILVPLAIVFVFYFLPDYFFASIIIGILGSAVFVAIKYWLVYPQLLDTSYAFYGLEGIVGTVKVTVTPQSGKITVGQELWDARCDVGEIAPGTKVRVIARDSMLVRVTPEG